MKNIFVIFTVIFLSGCSITGIFSKDPEFFVGAADLVIAYENDKISASETYDEKYIQVTGILNYMSGDNEEVTVQLFGGVVCSFTSNLEEIEDLKSYNKIVINGTVEGLDKNGHSVVLNKCDFVEKVTTPDVVTTAVELSSLETENMGYKIVEVTGVSEYIDESPWFSGWTLITEDVDANLIVYFETGYDFSEIQSGDTVKVTGTFILYTDFRTNSSYQIYGYEIEVVD